MYRNFNKIVVLSTTALYLLQPALALAVPEAGQLPTGGHVTTGSASISQNSTTLNIHQSTDRAAINWQSFDIGSNAHVNFNQPSVNSVALNRVLDGNPSQIFGRLTANGQVYLTNKAGMYFSPSASVNVGALVATAHGMSDQDFMNGKTSFSRNGSTGSVINEGSIRSRLGSYIALLAPEVRNAGVVVAEMGSVALAAGEDFALHFNSFGGLSDITTTKSNITTLVENKQAVQAPGGLIILSAQAVNSLQGGVVKNAGTIEATGFVNDGGVIKLAASNKIELGGSVNADAKPNSSGNGGEVIAIANLDNPNSTMKFSGSISARGGNTGGNGGFIETSGSHVDNTNARVDTRALAGKTGKWLIDPYDYDIDASAATAIETALDTSNVEVTTSANIAGYGSNGNSGSTGNIEVNAAINSSSSNELKLTAANTISVNEAITSGSLVLTGPGGITLSDNLTTTTDMTLNGNVTLGANSVLTSGISNTYSAQTTYTVPSGVTSITATLVGGAGGKGGNDGGNTGGNAGSVGSLTSSFSVTPGQSVYLAPGGGGSAGTNSASSAAGGAGGTNAFSIAGGGTGGIGGPTGSSGGGGGGGAATILSFASSPNSGTAMLVAAGGGGGGGSGNNAACPTSCAGQNGDNYRNDNNMAGQTGRNSGNTTPSIDDGGGSGGGGGGILGGLSNDSVFFVNEWTGRGGNVGSSGAANGFSTTSLSTSVVGSSNSQAGSATISYGGGAIDINGTINGARTLSISSPNNNISISGAIGGSSAPTSLSISGSQGISLAGGAVTTSGTQTYNGPLTLNANSTTFATTNSAVVFAANILKGSSVSSNMTVTSGSGAVNLNGSTGTSSTPIGTVGITTTATTNIAGTLYASSLTKSGTGATNISGGLVRTSGGQSYADIVNLGGNTTLSSTGTGDITLSKAVSNSNQSSLTINAASGNVSIVGNLARGTNAIPTPIGDVSVTASGTFTLGTSGTPILAEAKSLSVTADTSTVYASTSTFTTIGSTTGRGVHLTDSASFNVTSESTLTGPFSGAMSFTKSGAAKLITTGVNTFTGNTTVSAGILEIGGSGKIGNGSYSGNIAVTGQMRFNTSANNTLSGTMSGTGFINTVGSGTTDITTRSNQNYYNLITPYVVPIGTGSNSSIYGSSPTNLTYQLQTATDGGSVITDASPTGTAVFSGTPTSSSNAGSYTIGYTSGITVNNERYPSIQAGNDLSWSVTKKPLTVTVIKPYDGNAVFTKGFTLTGTVNGDATPAITSGLASVSSVSPGTYNRFISNTLALSNANYTLSGGTVSATIIPQSPVVSEITPKKPAETIIVKHPDQQKIESKLPDYNSTKNAMPSTVAINKPTTAKNEPISVQNNKPQPTASSPAKLSAKPTSENSITVSMVRAPSGQASGVISVVVPKDMASKSNSFSFALPAQVAVAKGSDISAITIKLENGSQLPSWIKFNHNSNTFVATNVPSGSLPLRVSISKGGIKSTIVISEHSQSQ